MRGGGVIVGAPFFISFILSVGFRLVQNALLIGYVLGPSSPWDLFRLRDIGCCPHALWVLYGITYSRAALRATGTFVWR